ncbi:hypothetical protein GCM10022198_09380 [Klugiella xanthotipulae]|uniref:PepSY domain-containing protein n=1 Tax=Klugiella xanthotipulae TaxID=244735 RepID=A0A543I6P6_9MICO|nr:hypothetical protein [Klugiella xanthotipulae]TQM66283.1 hypothetical protein FB466_1120 [Klugiella xanthotipulae]
MNNNETPESTPTTPVTPGQEADSQPTVQQPIFPEPPAQPGAEAFANAYAGGNAGGGYPAPGAPTGPASTPKKWWLIGGAAAAGLVLLGGGVAVGANAFDDDRDQPYTVTTHRTPDDSSTGNRGDEVDRFDDNDHLNDADEDRQNIAEDTDGLTVRGDDVVLDDATLTRVKDAALKAAGGTGGVVTDLDVEWSSRNGTVYEVEVQRADGTEADIFLNGDLTTLRVDEDGFAN